MSEWEEVKLGSIIEIIGGGTPKTSISEYWNGEIPWLSVVDFNHGKKYVKTTEKTITNLGFEKSSTKKLHEGDIIISARGTVGALAVLEREMTFNQSCYGIRGIEKISHTDYIYYLLKNTIQELSQISHGGVFDTITKSTFDEINISLPPLPEQQAIASVLSSLDDKIDLLHRQNKTLESMAETLFRQWFIEEARKDWELKKLGDLANITSSKRIFYSEYVEIGIPFYRSKEIIELSKIGSTKSELNISFEKFSEIDEKFGSPIFDDILITAVGTLGVIYQVKNNSKFYFKDGNLIWLKDFKGVHSNIIYAWLKSDIGQEMLYSISIGSTQPALTIVGLKNIELKLPPKNIRIELSENLESFYKKVNQNHSQIQTLENLRDTLLPKLMSGEIRVQH